MAVITKADLENAKLDAADLGDFVNSASGDVTPRLGSAYPNMRKLVDEVRDGGGLRTFANETALQLYEPAMPTLALVMSDPITAWRFNGTLPWVEAPEYFDTVNAISAAAGETAAEERMASPGSYGIPAGEALASGGTAQTAAATYRWQIPMPYDYTGDTLDIWSDGPDGNTVTLRAFDADGNQLTTGATYSGQKVLTLAPGANPGLDISDFFAPAGSYFGLYAQISVLSADVTKKSYMGGYWSKAGNATTGVTNVGAGVKHIFRLNVIEKRFRGEDYADATISADIADKTSYARSVIRVWDGSSLTAGNHGETSVPLLWADKLRIDRSTVLNYAVGGNTVNNWLARLSATIAGLAAPVATGRPVVLSIDCGLVYNTVNNASGSTPENATADIDAALNALYGGCATIKAAYPNVIINLVGLPNVNGPNKWTPEHYTAFLARFPVTAVASSYVDYITDVSVVPEGQDNTDTTYFNPDRVHPMTALNRAFLPVYESALNEYFWKSQARVKQDVTDAVLADLSDQGVMPFYATAAEAITALAVGQYFVSSDTSIVLKEGGTNDDGVRRQCKRISASPYYEHMGAGADPASKLGVDQKADVAELGTAVVAIDALDVRVNELEAAYSATTSALPYYATIAAAIADSGLATDAQFQSDDTGSVTTHPNTRRYYKKIAASPYWEDQGAGNAVAGDPISLFSDGGGYVRMTEDDQETLDNLSTPATVLAGTAIVDDATDKELLGFENDGDARVNGLKYNRAEPDADGVLDIIGFAGAARRVLAVDTATGQIIIGALDAGSVSRLIAKASAQGDLTIASVSGLSDIVALLASDAMIRDGSLVIEPYSGKELLGFNIFGDARINGIELNRVLPDADGILDILAPSNRRVLAVNTANGKLIIGAVEDESLRRLFDRAASLGLTSSGAARSFGKNIDTGVLRITFAHGQSLSVGGGQDYGDVSSNGTAPVLYHAQSERALMFSYGLCGSESAAIGSSDLGDLVPAREQWILPRGLGQTGGLAHMHQRENLQRKRGALDHMLYFTHGWGGQSITVLDTGSNSFNNGGVALEKAVALAVDYGLTPVFDGTIWWQGNQDRSTGMSQATYEGLLTALVSDLNTMQQAKLARVGTYPVYVVQLEAATGSASVDTPGAIAKAQRAVCENVAAAYMVGSPYYVPKIDGAHCVAAGYDLFNESIAWCIHQISVLGDTAFEPCWHTGISRSGLTITLTVHVPNGGLTSDTASVEAATNLGFAYSGASITDVSIGATSAETCDITITLDAAAAGTLSYAWETSTVLRGSDGAYPHCSAWGNIRDGAGAEIPSQTIPGAIVANWLIPFEETVA